MQNVQVRSAITSSEYAAFGILRHVHTTALHPELQEDGYSLKSSEVIVL